MKIGIQDQHMSYTHYKYNKTHEFVQLINDKKKNSNLRGTRIRAMGIIIVNLKDLNWAISYGSLTKRDKGKK